MSVKRTTTQEQPLTLDMPFTEALERFTRVNPRALDEPTATGAVPFIKWVGGKRSIISELTSRLPAKFGAYHEPFVGGGALFYELAPRLKAAHLSDSNLDLVLAYQAVKRDPDKLIKALEVHAAKNSDEYYYKVRKQHDLDDPIAIAARFIYLNKTCYNGLWRVNKKGEFNVPVGHYKNPNITQPENIRACSKALAVAEIRLADYTDIKPKRGDFVYFDPPYHPTDDAGANFTGYTKLDFTEKDQLRLAEFALSLHNAGVFVMLSNSDSRYIRSIYTHSAFTIETVQAPRMVNCKANGRGNVNEVLITNYHAGSNGKHGTH